MALAMQTTFYVMAGGAVGAALRLHVGQWVERSGAGTGVFGIPAGTLAVNVIGAALMGLLVGTLDARGGSEPVRMLLGVGLLGGFTTFSAFSLEAARLLQAGALGQMALYIGVSVVGTMLALIAGLALGRML